MLTLPASLLKQGKETNAKENQTAFEWEEKQMNLGHQERKKKKASRLHLS